MKKIISIVDILTESKKLWLTAFLYTILTGLFVQMILLPHIAPSWHAGNGLMKGMDAPSFHRIALELASSIRSDGWDVWELKPGGQVVSEVAAIFYLLIYPAPWSVLPLNAFLNASATVCLYALLHLLTESRRKSLISTLPFIFFPSALLWNTQFHNENYAIPGVFFILYGWALVLKKEEASFRKDIAAIIFIAVGSLLLGLVRDYILFGISFLFVFLGLPRYCTFSLAEEIRRNV